MLAIGMVASFLTSNLTMAFILGVVFNAPLVFAGRCRHRRRRPASAWPSSSGASASSSATSAAACSPSPGLAYFVMIVAVMLYLSMVLIGRRHWFTGAHRYALVLHYAVRALALAGRSRSG